MKRKLIVLMMAVVSAGIFAKEKVTGKVALGGNIIEKTDESLSFGNLYFLSDVSGGNDYVTVGGKLYYRLSLADDSKDQDKEQSLSQKIDLKRAYIRIRPFGKDVLEFSIGKLYSYYLPGNYFSLSEIYTGSSRWGKTGVGLKFSGFGFTAGIGLPVTESYGEFKNSFGINGTLGYDFKSINENVPLKIGATLLYSHSQTEEKDLTVNTVDDFSFTGSLNYERKFSKHNFSLNTTLSYSWNSEPYVASSVFKNVSNYNVEGLDKCQFASINQTLSFSVVKIILEGEAGYSLLNNWIPLYSGLQTAIKIYDGLSLRPRFYYYAALNSQDKDLGCQTLEVYPRIWFEKGKWLMYAGADFSYKQTAKNAWHWEWNIPCFVEYKF